MYALYVGQDSIEEGKMKKYSWLITVVMSVALVRTVAAQEEPVVDNPCVEDTAKFCASASNTWSLFFCLDDAEAALTGACRSRIDGAFAAVEGMRNSCVTDIPKFCNVALPKMLLCLVQNETKLSPDCMKDVKDFEQVLVIFPVQMLYKSVVHLSRT